MTGSYSAELGDLLRRASVPERAGRWEEAHALYGEAFRLAGRAADVVGMLRALLATARVLRLSQRDEAAEEVAELTLEIAGPAGRRREAARAINMLGAIRHQREDRLAARRFYLQALELARDEGDDELIAAICQNLGVVANALGDLREARALYLEGIGAGVRAGSGAMAGVTYNNLGMVCADLEEWTEAEVHFLRGAEIAERIGDLALLTRLLTGRAEPLIRTGEFGAARASLDRAEPLALRLNDQRALADVYRYRGTIARLERSLEAAETHLDRALAIAEEAGLELERAETLEEMAVLRYAERRHGAARVVLREARRIYGALGAEQDLARLDALRKQWEPAAREAPTGGP